MRVQAHTLTPGDVVRLQHHRVMIKKVESMGSFVRLEGDYYDPPNFSEPVLIARVVRSTRKLRVIMAGI